MPYCIHQPLPEWDKVRQTHIVTNNLFKDKVSTAEVMCVE